VLDPVFLTIPDTVDELYSICAIQNDTARQFWVETFKEEEVVPWIRFLPAIVAQFGLNMVRDANEIYSIHALLADSRDEVKQQIFSDTLIWFEPFDLQYPRRVFELLKLQSFFGNITDQQAESLLQQQPAKTYLVRFNMQVPGQYILSYKPDEKIILHSIIEKKDTVYKLTKYEAQKLELLINIAAKDLPLKKECPGSKYAKIFDSNTHDFIRTTNNSLHQVNPFVNINKTIHQKPAAKPTPQPTPKPTPKFTKPANRKK